MVFAQDADSPTPTPEVSPTPETTEATETTEVIEVTETTEVMETTEVAEGEPTPAETPPAAPSEEPSTSAADIIPMEGELAPSGGAPLDTEDFAPLPLIDQAMPDDAFTQPNAVIPDVAPPALGRSLDNAQEKIRLENIRYKQVRIEVEKNAAVANLLQQSKDAKTPEDKRAALREYYRLLFKKMVAVDKSLADKCQRMEHAYIRRLAQDRLEPTIPLNPPPTPEPLN